MIFINKAIYIDNFKVLFHFSDGIEAEIDLSHYSKKPGIFENLNNIDFFRDFSIDEELGTIAWKNGLDISPESLYFQATGRKEKWAE